MRQEIAKWFSPLLRHQAIEKLKNAEENGYSNRAYSKDGSEQ